MNSLQESLPPWLIIFAINFFAALSAPVLVSVPALLRWSNDEDAINMFLDKYSRRVVLGVLFAIMAAFLAVVYIITEKEPQPLDHWVLGGFILVGAVVSTICCWGMIVSVLQTFWIDMRKTPKKGKLDLRVIQ